MVSPRTPTSSNSSALFESDDTFLEALAGVVLPGDLIPQASNAGETVVNPSATSSAPNQTSSSSLEPPPCAQPAWNAGDGHSRSVGTPSNAQLLSHIGQDDEPSLPQLESPTPAQSRYKKRAYSVSSDDEHPAPAHSPVQSPDKGTNSYLDSDTYGASRFGGFGEYMSRKRAKLQIQNAEMGDTPAVIASTSKLFSGLSIHINGWTEPSVQELRKIIVENGGIYHPYLDKKTLITHIITCSLTPAKVREFKHMKVVRPEWLVQSVKAGVLLPWQGFIFVTGGRVESAQGHLAQTSLKDFSASKQNTDTAQGAGLARLNPASPEKAPSSPLPRPSSPQTLPLVLSPPVPPVLKYAEHKSNPAAQRAMADPAWRAEHTSMAPGFIAGYYANSRLHHLSTWKAELRTLVTEAQERAERGDVHRASESTVGVSMRHAALVMKNPLKGKEKAGSTTEQVIMHVDFDAFFVSAGLLNRPHLRGKPVVVCHSQHVQGGGTSSTSEIASASYEARGFGIKNGMSLQQARKLCPDVVMIPYEFDKYRELSLKFYTILMSFADDLQAVSVDEALIDVTSTVAQTKVVPTGVDDENDCTSMDIAKELAEVMRTQIMATTGCEASIGIASNIMLARLATRRAKPAGSFHLRPSAFTNLLPTLDVQDLHGFGRAAREKACERLGTSNLGELAERSKAVLCDALGKSMGETLYNAIRGVDGRKLESDKPRKSVSCDINYGIRFENDDQVEAFINQMAEEVARRLDAIGVKGRSLTLKIMKRDPSAPVEAPKFMGHGQCITYNKQSALADSDGCATSDPRLIGKVSWRLLRVLNIAPHELRGISIQIQKLDAPTRSAPTPAQARLPFRNEPNSTATRTTLGPASNARAPPNELVTEVEPEPEPKAPAKGMDLPSFSQIDMSVFDALPEDIRHELEAEYQRRRSAPPKPEPAADVVELLPRRASSALPPRGANYNVRARARGGGTAASSRGHQRNTFGGAGAGRQPPGRNARTQSRSRGHPPAPPRAPAAAPAVRVKPGELAELGLDAEVFAALPVRIQREQLAAARGARVRPSQQPVRPTSPLKPLQRLAGRWAPPKGPHEYVPPPPPPRARFAEAEKPGLRQQQQGCATVVMVVGGKEVRGVVRAWVEQFVRYAPHGEDVALMGAYLVRCAETDVGAERAVGVMRWWGALLRRRWAVWEHADERDEAPEPGEDVRDEVVGMAWWRAYREVASGMNEVVRKRFGGSLKLR